MTSQCILLPKRRNGLVGEKDHRGELVRVRLSETDLARASAIQDYHDKVGMPSNLQRVVADAISSYYFSLRDRGVEIDPTL